MELFGINFGAIEIGSITLILGYLSTMIGVFAKAAKKGKTLLNTKIESGVTNLNSKLKTNYDELSKKLNNVIEEQEKKLEALKIKYDTLIVELEKFTKE
jgi:formate-dependent nitrite reductase cytochrome c552 subunit